MIRLIASDLDGTLLLDGAQQLSNGTIGLIEELKRQGRIFAPASGRQYPNMRRLFAPEKDLYYICENGALLMKDGNILQQRLMARELGEEMIRAILAEDGCEVLVSGIHTSYIQPKESWFVTHLRDVVKNNITVTDDIFSVKEPYMKISVCQRAGIEKTRRMWEERFAGRAVAMVSRKHLDRSDAVRRRQGSGNCKNSAGSWNFAAGDDGVRRQLQRPGDV